ncbi:MAG: amidohydrolase family protein, partial [Spirochaetales bacterium]|nr:amidohydrolase family protein [Spirochaetales bacterium]
MTILLKNGRLIDGTGEPGYKADLLIENRRIAAVGRIEEHLADQVIDVSGKCVAPGFIDSHSHNDWFAPRTDRTPFFTPFAEQGITTQVTGNCGFSPFGYEENSPHLDLLGSGLFSRGAFEKEDFSHLQGFVEACGNPPLNILPIYGHMSSRISISGYANRELTPEEVKRQNALLERTLEEGAAGVSFGLMYEPDRYAPYEELKRAAEIASRRGKIVTVHARACSAASTSYQPPFGGRPHNLRALDEMARLARETGVKVQYSHLIFVGSRTWKTLDEALRIIDDLNREGLDFMYDSYAMTYGASVITVVLPSWYLGLPEAKRRSAAVRARMALEIGVTKGILGFDFEDIVIAWIGEGHEDLCGKNVHQIAREWKVSDLSAYLTLVDLSAGKGRVIMHKYSTPEILARLMTDPRCLCMTDAWVEEEGMQNPATFGCFPEFLRLAKERGHLEHTVRQMTGAAADRFGLRNRGYLKEGCLADITVFDPFKVAPALESDGRPSGIDLVFLAGKQIVENGIFSGDSRGEILL